MHASTVTYPAWIQSFLYSAYGWFIRTLLAIRALLPQADNQSLATAARQPLAGTAYTIPLAEVVLISCRVVITELK